MSVVHSGRFLVAGTGQGDLLVSNTALSFWGGVDSQTGTVIDRHHPLLGQNLAQRVLAIPGARGSCSGSGTLLELLLNGHAPAAIVVCGNPGLSTNPAARLFWIQDCSAATENILIAATGLGLGTVWIGIHPVGPFIRTVRQIVSLPRTVKPLSIVYVGYAETQKPPRTQYDAARVHQQRYGSRGQAPVKEA